MFIRYYLELDVPFADVESSLISDAPTWVPGLAREAEDRGQQLLAEVGFEVDPSHRIDKEVEIELGSPYPMPSKTLFPIAWSAKGAEGAFPRLEADIEIAPLGPSRTQLAISARYRPPFGVVGRVLDRVLMHRVAEATVKDFLDRAGERIAATVAAPADG